MSCFSICLSCRNTRIYILLIHDYSGTVTLKSIAMNSSRTCLPGERYEIKQSDIDRLNALLQILKLSYSPPPDPLPDWEIALKTIFYIPPFVIDIVGNIMVFIIVILNKRMRTTTNILILNLSVADITVALFCMWIHLGEDISQNWIFGEFLCRFNNFLKGLIKA